MSIVALEGLPGAGKTSLLTRLEQQSIPGLLTLPEHIFPEQLFIYNSEHNHDDEGIYQLHWEAKDALCQTFAQADIVVDRSYISCLAYNYAKAKLHGTPGLYEKILGWYQKSMEQGRLHPVDVCIYLKLAPALSNERKSRVESANALWTNLRALEYTQEFYETILPSLTSAYGSLRGIDANGTAEDVYKATLEILNHELR